MIKHLRLGDRVEFDKGGFGTIVGGGGDGEEWGVVSVEWDDFRMRGNPFNSNDPKKGKNISISLPSIDLGKKFNPIIRKA